MAAAARTLRERPDATDLPARLSVFGATRLEPDHVTVLAALAAAPRRASLASRPVPGLWQKVAEHLERNGPPASRRRVDDPTEGLGGHRLLAYLGRDARELQLTLAATEADLVDEHLSGPDGPPPPPCSVGCRPISPPTGSPLPAAARPVLDPADRSVVLHAAHGPDRQVEVLREVLVGLLADDPTLEPRDIVVMCPDIETFAPLIAAAFGLDTADTEAEHPGHRLRVRLADRSLRQLNPLLAVVSRVVRLADGRMPASAILDLCATAPVARKFSFTADEQDRLQDLVARAGVRWGLDAERRGRFGLADFGQNTWAAGLDRLLLGVAMDESEQRFLGTALPMDDVDSSDVDLIGRLAELVGRLRTLTDACRWPRPVAGWVELFKTALELLTEVSPTDRWQLGHAYAELSRLAEAAEASVLARAVPGRGRGPARRRLPRPGQPGELPHRHPHGGQPAADAGRPAPGGLPARRGRRDVPAPPQPGRRRHHRDRPVDRRPGPAQRGPAAAARRGHGGGGAAARSCTPAPTRGPAPTSRPRCRSVSCSTRST